MMATLVGALQHNDVDDTTPNNSDSVGMHEFARENSQKVHFHKKTQVKQKSLFDLLFPETEIC